MRLLLPAAAAVAALLLPATSASAAPCRPALFDAEPTLWDFDPSLEGSIFDGAHGASGTWRDDAFDGYGRLFLDVQGGGGPTVYTAPGSDACGREEDGREVTFPAVGIDGIQVSRKLYVPFNGPGFARWLDILTNASGAPITTSVRFIGNLGTDNAPDPPTTQIFGTSSGDATATTADTWAATDDGGAGGDPQIVHIWDEANGARADAPDAMTLANGNQNVDIQYSNVTLAAGQTAIYMHIAALRSTRDSAIAAAQVLQSGSGTVFYGMSAGEGDALRNWVGTDFDRDGVANATDNCAYTPNVEQTDINADGQGDGCDPDIDGDGASNADEERAGTNPRVADTDGDGVPDGADACGLGAGTSPNGCADTTRPFATVSRYARRPRRSSLMRRGLTAQVGCDEPCTVRVQLLRSARGLNLARSGDVVVGERLFSTPAAGRRTVRVRVNRRLRRAVRRGTRLTFRVVVSDAALNRRTLNRRITVR